MARGSLILILLLFYFQTKAQSELPECLNLLQRSKVMIKQQDTLIKLLKDDARLIELENTAVRKQFDNCEITLKYVNKELKKENKLKKVWQLIGVSALTGLLTTSIILITK
jgi:hypothetical protein